jgi:hypothetical protein
MKGAKMDSNGEVTHDGAAEKAEQMVGEHLARAKGRALVRRHLIEALAGLAPRRGQTVDAMRAEQAAVVERLCYMSDTNLKGLAECALRMAGVFKAGVKQAPAWPEPAQIFAWAFVIQVPPPHESDYVQSMMRSRLGSQAMTEGWHVALYRHVRRGPPPPVNYIIQTALIPQSREAGAMCARIEERMAANMHTPDDQRWLAAWNRDRDEAEVLVMAGRAARAAAAAAQIADLSPDDADDAREDAGEVAA